MLYSTELFSVKCFYINKYNQSKNQPENKITLAEDYISTVANYLTAEMNESDVYGKPTTKKQMMYKTILHLTVYVFHFAPK